jgi:hypothetical protein
MAERIRKAPIPDPELDYDIVGAVLTALKRVPMMLSSLMKNSKDSKNFCVWV